MTGTEWLTYKMTNPIKGWKEQARYLRALAGLAPTDTAKMARYLCVEVAAVEVAMHALKKLGYATLTAQGLWTIT